MDINLPIEFAISRTFPEAHIHHYLIPDEFIGRPNYVRIPGDAFCVQCGIAVQMFVDTPGEYIEDDDNNDNFDINELVHGGINFLGINNNPLQQRYKEIGDNDDFNILSIQVIKKNTRILRRDFNE